MRRTTTTRRHALAVALVVALIAEATVGFVVPPDEHPTTAPAEEGAERAWEGGGSRLLFVDDMRPETAGRLAASGAPVTQDYYGGALSEPRDGPARWAPEPYRWGTHSMEGPAPAWTVAGEAWRFGDDTGYPAGSHAETVTPVIDLRSVPVPPEVQAHASMREVKTCRQVVTNSQTADAVCLVSGTEGGLRQDTGVLLQGGEVEVQDPVRPAAVAMRLRHDYDFDVGSGGDLRDGGRVEASRLDPSTGDWTPWQGIAPTDKSLRIGQDEIRARAPAGQGATVEAGLHADAGEAPGETPNARADAHVVSALSVAADSGGNTTIGNGSRPSAHLYQGAIASSTPRGGPWQGFGGDSEGLVTSVFDMTPYAGSLVRLRFVASTANALDAGDSEITGHGGWVLDDLEVHGVEAESVAVVGLAVPGNGAILVPGTTVRPMVALHNTERVPVVATVATTLGGVRESRSVELGVGPAARAVVATGHTLSDLEAGLYAADVSVSVSRAVDTQAAQAEATLAQPGVTRFHFAASHGSGWAPRSMEFVPLVDPDGDGELEEDAAASRSIARQQPARIHLPLDNTGPSAQTVRLGATGEAEWDVRPALVDELGNEFGTVEPLSGPDVVLPPSREVAGTAGAPGTTSVTWAWSGTDSARALQLVLRVRDAAGQEDTIQGGTVVVQSTLPPAISVDYRNPWVLDGGGAACSRVEERLGARGVAHCPAAPARIISAAHRIQEIDLLRGNAVTAQVRYTGGPLNLTLQATEVAVPGERPPEDAVFTNLTQVPLPETGTWTFQDSALGEVPPTFSGFLRLVVDADGPVDLDLLRLALRVGNEAESLFVPLLSQDWDTTLDASRRTVEASGAHGLVHLHGQGVVPDVPPQEDVQAVGDVHASTGDVPDDAVLVLPGPLDLSDLARPEIHFRHWHELGPHGRVVLEAAPAPLALPEDRPASAASHPASEASGWRTLAQYRFDTPGLATRAQTVSLADFAGTAVHLRFRYHVDATVLTQTDRPQGAGWVVEGISVSGWNATGPVEALAASEGFTDEYEVVHGQRLPSSLELPDAGNDWVRDGDRWSLPAETDNPYGVNALVTNAIDLGAMQTPALALSASFHLSGVQGCPSPRFPHVDVEYQIRQPDGTWPAAWQPADPVVRTTTARAVPNGDGTPYHWWLPGGLEANTLADPTSGLPNGRPFSTLYGSERGVTCDREVLREEDDDIEWIGSTTETQGYESGETEYRFDLEPLHRFGARSEPVRLRIHAWGECYVWNRVPPCGDTRLIQPLGDTDAGDPAMQVHAVEIGEFRHAVDAAVSSVRLLSDGAPYLAGRAPAVLQEFAPGGQAVVGQESQVDIAVNVSNEGFVPVDLSVSLQGVAEDGTPLDIAWVEVRDGAQVPRQQKTGLLSDLPPGKTGQVLFRGDLRESPPGNYTFSTRVDVTNGADTNPGNDLADLHMRLLPVRDLAVDVAASDVEPFATGPGDGRAIRATVANNGNVDEGLVRVEAQIVRMTGLTSFAPLDPPLPGDLLAPWEGSLAGNGDGRREVQWVLDPDVLAGVDLSALQPGQKYAVKVTVSAAPESVTQWWPPFKGAPLGERDDGTGILNITRMPDEDCGCALIPFIVERNLYGTDLSPGNSTSVAPAAFPVATTQDILRGWRNATYVGGEPLDAGERPDLPRWTSVAASDAGAQFPGLATGRVWHLPAYDGLEPLHHELVSPTLPSHIVRDDSRAILSLRHAMQDMADGQVRLDTRTRVGGEWTDWEPVDDLRSKRVAVVLAPDFPQVVAGGLSSMQDMYNAPALRGSHPVPPFYDNPLGLDYIEPNGPGQNDNAPVCLLPDRCEWTPPPDFDPQAQENQRWLRALNDALRRLSAEVGPGNIGLFTTISPDLGVGEAQQGQLFYDVQDGPLTRRFAIQDLDTLGLRLDTYGAILLMGDNTTSTLADRSQALVRMSHGGQEWIHRDGAPPALAAQHHEDLFAILRAAPGAGVQVLGAAGPAAATLSQSGVVGDTPMAVWQTSPMMPNGFRHINSNLHCTGQQPQGNLDQYMVPPNHPQMQPLNPCLKSSANRVSPDPSDPHNYYRISPRDAQSLALRDLVPTASATLVSNQCLAGQHPLVVPPQVGPASCNVFVQHRSSQVGDISVVTAGWPSGNQTWVQSVLDALSQTRGVLPAGQGTWSDLPPQLSFPVGGRFWRDDAGRERFDGLPMQVRITVEADPGLGGHGAMGVDRIGLLGTNRTQGVGVELIQPTSGASYAPGRSFTPAVQVMNRGVLPTGNTTAEVAVEQWVREGDCVAQDVPDVLFQVPALEPGQQVRIDVEPPAAASRPNGGVFPHDPECATPRSDQEYVFNFTARLDHADLPADQRPFDDDRADDADHATAIGREHVEVEIAQARLRPAQSVAGGVGTVLVETTLESRSTQTQAVTLTATLRHARPLACNQASGPSHSLFGCGSDGQPAHPIPLAEPTRTVNLPRDGRTTVALPIDVEKAGLDPGVYRLRITAGTVDSGQQGVGAQGSPWDLWMHLAADGNVLQARTALPPDGAWATDFTLPQDIQSLPTTAQVPGVWDPQGVFLQGNGQTHNGAFGPDTVTQDSQTGANLAHGWRLVDFCLATGAPFDPDAGCRPAEDRVQIIEWRRDGTPAFRVGQDSATRAGNQANPPPSYSSTGHGDFGPDRIVWIPHDPRDTWNNPSRDPQPYLSLASLDDPEMTFLARFEATQNTAFVIEMQVPQRNPCQNQGTPPTTNCPGTWNWATPWHTITPDAGLAGNPLTAADVSVESRAPCNNPNDPCTTERNIPSNPLAGQTGLWGQRSDGPGGDGWMRLRFPIDIHDPALTTYCTQVAQPGGTGEARHPAFHPCRYAHASGTGGFTQNDPETYVARPVRFRISAASFGGDVGSSFLQIADIALSSHRVEVAGPETIAVTMDDNDEALVPVRLRNAGSVEDTLRVTWDPPLGTNTLLGNTSVELARTVGFADPAQELLLDVAPGETETVWVRLSTGISRDLHPGTEVDIPFRVVAQSTIDPTADTQALVDASYRSRAWPDLEVPSKDGLILDDDASGKAFHGPVGSPVQVTAVLRNQGDIPIGGPQTPIRVDLVEREVNATDGSVVPGTQRVVRTVHLGETIRPFRDTSSDTLVRFGEWVPPRVGLFEVEAVANPPGPLALPEQRFDNNGLGRQVIAGPVRFADLHVTDAWLVEFRDGCGDQPVAHIVAGHTYCVAAHVENRGRQGALSPRAAFGVGTGQPFSFGAPSLEEMFPGGVFPGTDGDPVEVVVKSSPRTLDDRASGAWRFYTEVSSRSVFPNLENKTHQIEVPVFRFGLDVDDVPPDAALAPGAQSTFHVDVTNTGNAPTTPILSLEGPETYRLVSPDPPRLIPGETERLPIRISVSPTATTGEGMPTLFLSTLEDDLIREPLETTFHLEQATPPRATTLSASAPPGPANATLALDNAQGARNLTWQLLEATGSVEAAAWTSQTAPFERRTVQVPLEILPHTPPGRHAVALRLLATDGSVGHEVDAVWSVHVLPHPRLEATGPDVPVTTVAGTPASVPLQVANNGNVPLRVKVVHDVDEGTLDVRQQAFLLAAGDSADVAATVAGGQERMLGRTVVSWTAPDGSNGTRNLTWTVQAVPSRVTLVSTDLPDLRPRALSVNTLAARLSNPGTQPVEAEAVVTVDGHVHGRVAVRLDPGRPQDVLVAFQAGPAGQTQQVLLLVRPAGSSLGPDDEALYDVGDARGAALVAREDSRGIPGASPLLAIGLLAALTARRRWP